MTGNRAFAAGLLAPASRPPAGLKVPAGADVAHRFGVYRNNVIAGLIKALAERFPVVEALVGEDFFRVMARIYVIANPPRSPLMFRYGENFPSFIKHFPPAASVPYLADVARLEFLRGEAYHAADAAPVEPRHFAKFPTESLLAMRLTFHPSMRLLASPFPVVSIWRAHQEDANPAVAEWRPEVALVARPELEVELHRVPTSTISFLTELVEGRSIGEASAIAAEDPSFDPASAFIFILQTRIVIELF